LKESLTSLDGHVRELEKHREGAYKEMVQRLLELRDTHARLQQSTISLTEALRSPTVRGRWARSSSAAWSRWRDVETRLVR